MKTPGIRFGKSLAALFSTMLFFVLSSNVGCAMGSKTAASKSEVLNQSYTWYDGDREQKVWLNPHLVAEFNPGPEGEKAVKSAYSAARIVPTRHKQAGIRIWHVDNAEGDARKLKSIHPQGKYSAILHDGPNGGNRMRALPGNIIVYLDPQWSEAKVNSWLNAHKLEVVKKLEIGPNMFVIKTGPGLDALDTANSLYRSGEVKAAFPDWWQEVTTR